MKYFFLPVIVLSLMILYSCKDSAVNNPGGPGTTETLVISIDSVYFTDQSANMFSIDTLFINTSLKKFRITFISSTNDTDNHAILGLSFMDSTNTIIWNAYKTGKAINISFNENVSLNIQGTQNLKFYFSMFFNQFNNPPLKWLKLLNFKLYSVI